METIAKGVAHYSNQIELTGVLPGNRTLPEAEILVLADVHVGDLAVQCYSGRHVRALESARGVRLTTLLDLAGMQTLPVGQRKRCLIVAQAADGYACLFTWHELYNTPVGEGVLVLVEQDGVLLGAEAGGLQMVSLHDLRLGPRQAAALTRIDVQRWNG
jgi:hypothetical protein